MSPLDQAAAAAFRSYQRTEYGYSPLKYEDLHEESQEAWRSLASDVLKEFNAAKDVERLGDSYG